MTTYHLTKRSANVKTGPIPVSTTSADSCPNICPLKDSGACYAKHGKLGMHWRKVSNAERGDSLQAFCDAVAAFKPGQLWRHNQAGDLPGNGVSIDLRSLRRIVAANSAASARGFTYTHYSPKRAANAKAIQEANAAGFTVNLSANSIKHAQELQALNVAPVVAVAPAGYERGKTETLRDYVRRMAESLPDGFGVCPATYADSVNCKSCGLCAEQNRPSKISVVVFPAHGTGKNKIDADGVKATK